MLLPKDAHTITIDKTFSLDELIMDNASIVMTIEGKRKIITSDIEDEKVTIAEKEMLIVGIETIKLNENHYIQKIYSILPESLEILKNRYEKLE